MKQFCNPGGALVLILMAVVTSCAAIKPAGSLGQGLHGDTRLRPVPENYRHVPPKMEPREPLQFQVAF